MYSLIMLPLVITNIILVIWLTRSWLQTRDWLLLLTLIMMIALPYDTGIVMLGGMIGEGDLLRLLSAPRINWLYLTAPLLPIIAIGIARRGGLAWAQSNVPIIVLCVVAVGFLIYDAARIFQMPVLYPACFEDVLRYVTSVKPDQACRPGQPGINVPGGGVPWAGLAGMVVLIVVGVWLWWKRGWPWLVLGMIGSASVLSLPATASPLGPLTVFYGDFLSMASILWTAIHFAKLHQASAQG